MAERDEIRRTIRVYFRQLNWLFFTFFAGLVTFMVVAWIITGGGTQPIDASYEPFLRFAAPISGIALIVIANRLYQQRVKPAREAEKLYQKMDAYRGGVVLRMIVMDGAAFINLIAFLAAGSYLFLILCAIVLVLFVLTKPNLEKFIDELHLNATEEQVMRDHTI
jgi:hypothetical protein